MPPDSPNILFFLTDQQRADWVGMNPDIPVRTPNIADLADRGVWFRNTFTPSPVCAPARACLASGMDYDRCGVLDSTDEDFPKDRTTYYRRLRDEAEYHVVGCGKFDLQKGTQRWGLAGKKHLNDWGFTDGINSGGKGVAVSTDPDAPRDPYMAFLHEENLAAVHAEDFRWRVEFGGGYRATWPTPLPSHAYLDNWIARKGLDLLAECPKTKPWHLVINFAGPHPQMDVTNRLHTLYRDPPVDFPLPAQPETIESSSRAANQTYSHADHQAIRRNYAAMIENIDRWLGRYISELQHRGEFDETLIIFASDHGEMLGDFGLWSKQAPFESSVKIPLIMAGPGIADQPPVNSPASLLDLHATILEYAAIDPGPVDSRSMRSVLNGTSDAYREVVRSGLGPWRLVTDGRYELIAGYDPTVAPREQVARFESQAESDVQSAIADRDPILYDLETTELTNQATTYPHKVSELWNHLPPEVTQTD